MPSPPLAPRGVGCTEETLTAVLRENTHTARPGLPAAGVVGVTAEDSDPGQPPGPSAGSVRGAGREQRPRRQAAARRAAGHPGVRWADGRGMDASSAGQREDRPSPGSPSRGGGLCLNLRGQSLPPQSGGARSGRGTVCGDGERRQTESVPELETPHGRLPPRAPDSCCRPWADPREQRPRGPPPGDGAARGGG